MSKYLKQLPPRVRAIDVYRVLDLFGVTRPGLQHAAKKILFAGQRGAKSFEQDVREAIQALERELEMLVEDIEGEQ